MQKTTFLFALLLIGIAVGCGDYKRFQSESPDGRARVEATVPSGLFAPAFRVVLIQEGREHELYLRYGFETFDWLEVYWDTKNELVGILTCSDPNLNLAVDRRTLKSIPFSMVETPIRRQVEKKFGAEVLTWNNWKAGFCYACCSPEGMKRRQSKVQ